MSLMDAYAGPWTSSEVAHLTRRTTFGVSLRDFDLFVSAGMSSVVDNIVNYQPVDIALETMIAGLPETDPASDSYRIKYPIRQNYLEGWWLYRMVNSTQPFQQQFALFLHDHFVSEYTKTSANVTNKVNDGSDGNPLPGTTQSCNRGNLGLPPDPDRKRKIVARMLQDQHRLFLTIGHGGFRDMLLAITRDPCMLIYLDNQLNRKGKPQENYAREVMELFTMGVNNYSEKDVREAAKAFTGETLIKDCPRNWPYSYWFNPNDHDATVKEVFGQTFNNGAGDTETMIDLILNRISNSSISPNHSVYPATALYMSWKFITWFVHESIPIGHDAVRDLAIVFNSTINGIRFNVRETLRTLFKSQFFYDPAYRFNMYKHPVDYMVTAMRSLHLQDSSYTGTAYTRLRQMGMQLFEPPTVEGWHHGRAWINSSHLIARFNYADRLASSTTIFSNAAIDALITSGPIQNYADNAGIIQYFTSRLLPAYTLTAEETAVFNNMFNAIKGAATSDTQSIYRRKVRAALHLTMTMPRYQLK